MLERMLLARGASWMASQVQRELVASMHGRCLNSPSPPDKLVHHRVAVVAMAGDIYGRSTQELQEKLRKRPSPRISRHPCRRLTGDPGTTNVRKDASFPMCTATTVK